jgi:hypothetical protein
MGPRRTGSVDGSVNAAFGETVPCPSVWSSSQVSPGIVVAREDGRADEGDGLENGLSVRRCAYCAAKTGRVDGGASTGAKG